MAGNPLAKFFATVGFKADTSELDATIKRVKQELQSITGSVKGGANGPLNKAKERLKVLQAKEKQILQEYQNQLGKNKVEQGKLNQEKKKFEFLNYKTQQNLLQMQQRHEVMNQRSKQRILENQSKSAVLQQRSVIEQAKAAAAQARARISEMKGTGGRSSVRMSSDGVMTGGVGGLTARGAVGSLATGGFGMSSYKVGQFTTSRMPQFEFITGSAEEARKQIAFVDSEVNRLSLNLIEANTQYKNLLATGASTLGIENTQKLFSNFQNLSTVLGLSTDAQNRALKAFSQMASKGQIMAEELDFRLGV